MRYFDSLVEKFKQEPDLETAFGQHIHWGFWQYPQQATGELKDFGQAANNLSKLVLELAQIPESASILDAGCGFGGTINLLNQTYSHLKLFGLNIDQVQVEKAKEIIQPKNGNSVEFIHGDACQFPDFSQKFDIIIALECIFAFPSRERFFDQAHHFLKPGGQLIIVDFLISPKILLFWSFFETQILSRMITNTYGSKDTEVVQFIGLESYKKIAQKTGFNLVEKLDITGNVQPTYKAINKLIIANSQDWLTAKGLEFFSLAKLITYEVLIFNSTDTINKV
ncbi:MAG: methyltransferase domain-containing protein [Limnoraphis robusta]|uniref:Ubiquinone/menaquinone biosynthesis protein n=1 Tax=Limnoraphis robusta CS-951 TaxID=1637645 RepID=A0A0F5YFE3_9CYAN|nr:class I SAM-dependent methyltransferase [Limnoraphis robusta]KKD37493.1 ubiquinone/menaquinone biosynthesis protein [Limnoraphis robusta CS-951]